MDRAQRRALQARLLAAAPWLGSDELGPRAVDAGNCDRCEGAPRLLPTCGPGSDGAVCRDCAHALGDDGWCDGHLDDGRAARQWAARLPDRWAEVVVAWWISTGEVRLAADATEAAVRAALPSGPGTAG